VRLRRAVGIALDVRTRDEAIIPAFNPSCSESRSSSGPLSYTVPSATSTALVVNSLSRVSSLSLNPPQAFASTAPGLLDDPYAFDVADARHSPFGRILTWTITSSASRPAETSPSSIPPRRMTTRPR